MNMQNNKNFFELKSQLKEFGLNPTEWKLNRNGKKEFLIISNLDSDFIFKGTTQKKLKKMEWRGLQLVSL